MRTSRTRHSGRRPASTRMTRAAPQDRGWPACAGHDGGLYTRAISRFIRCWASPYVGIPHFRPSDIDAPRAAFRLGRTFHTLGPLPRHAQIPGPPRHPAVSPPRLRLPPPRRFADQRPTGLAQKCEQSSSGLQTVIRRHVNQPAGSSCRAPPSLSSLLLSCEPDIKARTREMAIPDNQQWTTGSG